MNRNHPLAQLTLARIREFIREPEAVFWVFVFPVLMALGLGIAFRNNDSPTFRVAVDPQWVNASVLTQALQEMPELVVVPLPPQQANRSLAAGKVDAMVLAGDNGNWVVHKDPARPESLTAMLLVENAIQRMEGRTDVAKISAEDVTERGSRYIDFLIPGLIGLNLMGSSMWGIGYAVVHARVKKLLKRLAATPMRRSHYLLSFVFSRLVFLIAEVAAIMGFGWLVFGVGCKGSLASAVFVAVLGAAAFAGIGLMIAARPRTTEAVSGWMNLVQLPMWLLSGSFFSYERFPEVLHPLFRLLPLTAINDGMRAIMNEGAGLLDVWHPVLVLAVWSVVSFGVALKFFRWQ